MNISLFDMFSIGIGPSSSHTVGPMYAANEFIHLLEKKNFLNNTVRIKIELYGSLALTGKGHGTDKAILNGLEGKAPETVKPETMIPRMQEILTTHTLFLAEKRKFPFMNPVIFFIIKKKYCRNIVMVCVLVHLMRKISC